MTDPTPSSVHGAHEHHDAPSPSATLDELRAALVLQREADEMIAEALETRRSAVERAAALVHEAEQRAERAEEIAAAAASQRIAAAREQADRILDEARARADEITQGAHAEISALRDDAAELRDNARETLEAAGLELESSRQAAANRERQLVAALAEAVRTVEHLEGVTAALDDALTRVRGEVAAARDDLTRLHGDFAAVDAGAVADSVVLPWPHQAGQAAADPATTDGEEETSASKHRRTDAGSRLGLLRRSRP